MGKFKTMKDYVYDHIAEKILMGQIAPGEKINEATICEDLSISRTPVREALIELACTGVLENHPRKGFTVKELTYVESAEVYTIIGCLEGLAAELSIDNLTEEDFRDMQFYIDSVDVALSSGNFRMYHVQQVAFHDVFIRKCGNDLLIEEIDQMKKKLLKRSYSTEIPDIVTILKETNEQHREILRMLKEKDRSVNQYLAQVHWNTSNSTLEIL